MFNRIQVQACILYFFSMKNFIATGIFLFMIPVFTQAQELFTYTEPASNMPAKSIGIRLTNNLMKDNSADKQNYHLVPELMWGVSGKLMIHGEAFISNRNGGLVTEGGGVYFKYRFYSQDEVHDHFRMAFYGRASVNNSDVHQPAIDLNGHNSGYEAGLVSTKLIKRTAISGIVSWLHATDNIKGNKFNESVAGRNAVGFSLSAGRLMLPREYTSYDQTNLNFMIEMPGQVNLKTGTVFIDIAPSVQFIFLSKMRLDIGYRFPLVNNLARSADNGFLFRFEYNIFSAYK